MSQSGTINRGRSHKGAWKLFEVIVLKAHNSRRGREKAPDERFYIYGKNPVHVKDIVETYRRIPGIKLVVSVRPVEPGEFVDRSKVVG